jgi:SNF2 family DNA or RNA helicase
VIKASYDVTSLDGRNPYGFQIEGMQFLEDAGFRALLADEMGLGKTIQAVVPIKLHSELLTPALILCKSGLRQQQMTEAVRWCGKKFAPYIIQNSKDGLINGFPIYIASYDVLRRKGVLDRLEKVEFQYMIIDECQHIKNPDSARAGAVRRLAKSIPHIVATSGTPIKNRASEYFTILNLLSPAQFHAFNAFLYNHVKFYRDEYGKVKERGLSHPEQFKEMTKHFIIRRTREEVMPELPKIDRKFFHVDLSKSAEKAYFDASSKFAAEYDAYVLEGREESFAAYQDLLAKLSRLRHIAGLSVVPDAIDYVREFLSTTERKIAVFVHHKDIGQLINSGLTEYCKEAGLDEPMMLTSDLTMDQRSDVVTKFREEGRHKILIASTLASGEGLNLQYQCSDALIVERQWNPANEEQVEARFTRPDAISKDYVSATYMIVSDTIVEWFTELVEKKRQVIRQILDGKDSAWQESELVRELMAIIAKQGRKQTWNPTVNA